ncbi:MAG: AAA family ATPase [Chitinophagales bacterium]
MKKIPYGGVGSFNDLVTEGYLYIDRTQYIRELEALSEKHLFFLRPRRFGKSLFISVLHHYYGWEHQDKFEKLFGAYNIGHEPTSLKNSYLVLKFNFSGVNTATDETTYNSFLESVRLSVATFLETYDVFFDSENLEKLEQISSPEIIMKQLWHWVKNEGEGRKVYVLIDEYDQFTNEIIAYRFEEFKTTVSRNGWVRKFYETLKIGSDDGIVSRTFITGVTPITLDSLTSGFSGATDISGVLRFHEMMGFRQEEVIGILQGIGIEEADLPNTMGEMKMWYDGYVFHKRAKNSLYNSEMVLYFAQQYLEEGAYPEKLLATSVATDYHKIRSMFRIAHKEKENIHALYKILVDKEIKAQLTIRYNFEIGWQESDFVSLLYYLGFLTIKGSLVNQLIFTIPNYVIRELYYQYFMQITLERANLDTYQIDIQSKVLELAMHNNIEPIIHLTESVLAQLSANHDHAAFNETHPKSIFASWFYAAGIYHIYSEFEVEKKNEDNEKGRVDLLLTRRQPFDKEVPHQFIFELKYLKKAGVKRLKTIKKEAASQLEEYLKDDKIKEMKDLKAYVVVFVGNKADIVRLK